MTTATTTTTDESSTPVVDAQPGLGPLRLFRAATILVSHAVIDLYSAIVPATLGLIEARCALTAIETSLIVASMSLVSGVAQPICALFSDRHNSRLVGGVGLALASVVLCLVGRVVSFWALAPIVIVGYFGVGIYHPVAAASMGALSDRWRSALMGLFFVAGMLGASFGAWYLPVLVQEASGLHRLERLIVPGLVVAGLLHLAIRGISHRTPDLPSDVVASKTPKGTWGMVGILYVATTFRAAVYVTLQFMLVRLVQAQATADHPELNDTEIADLSAPTVGKMISMMIIGMAVGGLASGFLVRRGREKLPLLVVPIAFSPAIAVLPFVQFEWGAWFGLLAGIGFASMSPVALSVSQRLLPRRTSLASSLMLGGAWAVAAIGPVLAQTAIPAIGIHGVFQVSAAVLAFSGLLALLLDSALLRESCAH